MSSIQEVVWNLKGTFLDKDFQEAENALVKREENLREKCISLETELKQKSEECLTKDETIKHMQREISLLKVLKDEAIGRYSESVEKEKEMKEKKKEIAREKEELERLRKEVSEIEKVRREKGVVEMENRELKRHRDDLRKENKEMGDKLKEQIEKVEMDVVELLYTSCLGMGRGRGDVCLVNTQFAEVVDRVVKALDSQGNGGVGDEKDAAFQEAVLSNNDNPKRCFKSGMDFDDVSRRLLFEKEPSPEDVTGPPNVISLDSESDDDSPPDNPHKRKQPSEMKMNDEDNSDDWSTIKQKVKKLDSLLELVPAFSGSRCGQEVDCREGCTPDTTSYTPRAMELIKACRRSRAIKTLVSVKDAAIASQHDP